MTSIKVNDIQRIKNIKKFFLTKAYKNHIDHLPSSLSCLEILYVLYNKIANITKENVKEKIRDRVIISKEHSRFGQICVLNECGLLDEYVVDSHLKSGGFVGHDIYNIVGDEKIAAIDIASGSLGHGLGVGIGLAIASPTNNIYVICGDGELQEGSCWEAIMFIGHNNLRNLTIVVDRNSQQIDDLTKNIIDTSKFSSKAIEAFGLDVCECDGHNVEDLESCFKHKSDKPKCIIANTIKGKEIHFKQDTLGCAFYHWETLSENDYKRALSEVQ